MFNETIPNPNNTMIRAAVRSDIPALLSIENASFHLDRINRRSFLHLLTQANSTTLVDEKNKQVRGYLTLLFRANSALSRVYSIATHSDFFGMGVAAELLRVAEQIALRNHCGTMRLEIRMDNPNSLTFFKSHGYQKFGEYPSYYQDGMDAYRLYKPLTHLTRAHASPLTGSK